MIKAGPVVDLVLEKLLTFLEEGDIIIDGGNSHYEDTQRRYDLLIDKGIYFIGAGISGGEEGARKGPSIMPGGSRDSYLAVADILESIAARDPFGKTCCTYIGPGGSGHFIKMVHNGIEYVEMQLLAEMYALMSLRMSNESIANIFETWNRGALSSYLLDITVQILRKKEGEHYVLDLILDKAGNKGTGSWSSKAAFDMGVPNTMMSAAVFARYVSSFKEERRLLSEAVTPDSTGAAAPDLNQLEKAYSFARLINHQQGFKLMRLASDLNDWKLNFKDIARIWSNGCIIKSQLMNQLYEEFGKEDDLFKMNVLIHELTDCEHAVREVVKAGLDHRISMHCFTNALYYWTDMTSDRLPANLIQAQRDFFGAHTYQRTDRDPSDYFHTKWT
jgi:6-phosphogluconate dehydrogenase